MEQKIAEDHNVNYKDLYNNMDVNDMILKMGYDGLTIGTGKDMIIVKYSSKWRLIHLPFCCAKHLRSVTSSLKSVFS